MDRRRNRFPLQSEKNPRSGSTDDCIFSGDFKLNLCYVTCYDGALFSVMGHVITSNRSDFLLQVKIKKVVWGRPYEPAAAGGLSQAATGSVLAKGHDEC